MIYEIITVTNYVDDSVIEYIQIDNEDGSFESFLVDESNPRYQQFLLDLEQENK